MSFDEWYEKNKESLSQTGATECMRRAWEAGVAKEKSLLLKGFLSGMKKGMSGNKD